MVRRQSINAFRRELVRRNLLLGNGIVTSDGELWRTQRYMMQPMFHRRILDQFSRLIHDVNETFAARWAAKVDNGDAVLKQAAA